jgi:hypothetical protein
MEDRKKFGRLLFVSVEPGGPGKKQQPEADLDSGCV